MANDILNSTYFGHGEGRDGLAIDDGEEIVARRHCDWAAYNLRWRRLLDSYEGGEQYRDATYGQDWRGLPARNLIRHPREIPDSRRYPEGYVGASDPYAIAGNDDYEMRRYRTPVPEWVAEAAGIHLGKIYDRDPAREGPEDLTAWWEDVDGRGTKIDDYMRETIAPLLLVLGCLDVLLDHPPPPDGVAPRNRLEERQMGVDRCVIGYILPQNMVWWRMDRAGRYVECLVREYADPSERDDFDQAGDPIDPEYTGADVQGRASREWREKYLRFRHWTGRGWVLWNYDGSEVLGSGEHPYGTVPIVRLIDTPVHRCPHVGKSRYGEVAALQCAFYNVDSELTLSNTLQAHPTLSGAADMLEDGETVPVGPGNILPMKRMPDGGYQGWEYVSPPKDPAMSLADKLREIEDRKDRAACLAKPAGTVATATTTAQSGVSKQLDAVTGHKMLSSITKSLKKADQTIAWYALMALRGRMPTPEMRTSIYIEYASKFELFSASEALDNGIKLQLFASQSGDLPKAEGETMRYAVRQINQGLKAEEYAAMDAEIMAFVETKSVLRQQMREQAPDALDGQDQGDETKPPDNQEY